MTLADAIDQLDRLPFAFHVGKGRARRGEPLWAVALFREVNGVARTDDDPEFIVEGDDLPYCVTRAMAWAEQQPI